MKFTFLSVLGEKHYSFEEFIPIVKQIAKETDTGTLQDFMEAFKSFDREGMGYISLAEMRHMLTAMGKTCFCHFIKLYQRKKPVLVLFLVYTVAVQVLIKKNKHNCAMD